MKTFKSRSKFLLCLHTSNGERETKELRYMLEYKGKMFMLLLNYNVFYNHFKIKRKYKVKRLTTPRLVRLFSMRFLQLLSGHEFLGEQ